MNKQLSQVFFLLKLITFICLFFWQLLILLQLLKIWILVWKLLILYLIAKILSLVTGLSSLRNLILTRVYILLVYLLLRILLSKECVASILSILFLYYLPGIWSYCISHIFSTFSQPRKRIRNCVRGSLCVLLNSF